MRFTVQGGGSLVKQSGLKRASGATAQGLLLRGVVLATYEVDAPEHPYADNENAAPVAIYCDVRIYGQHSNPNLQNGKLTGVLVAQPQAGLFDGQLWRPRPTRIDIQDGSAANPDGGTRLENLDGDHVLVSFIDGSPNLPVIIGSIPHPNTQPSAQLVGADGRPLQHRHNGVRFGVTGAGDFEIDTTESSIGPYTAGPAEPADGAGNLSIALKDEASATVTVGGGASLTVEGSDADALITVGDGAVSVAIAETLKTYIEAVIEQFLKVHTHPTAMGPSGPPVEATLFSGALAYDDAITSTQVKIPDNP